MIDCGSVRELDVSEAPVHDLSRYAVHFLKENFVVFKAEPYPRKIESNIQNFSRKTNSEGNFVS